MNQEVKVAPCGLLCSHCDAYRATQMNDPEKYELVAAKWRELNHCDEIKAEHIPCDGCMSKDGRKTVFCLYMCKIRQCILSKGYQVCSECPEFETCETFNGFFEHSPEGQKKAVKQLLNAIKEMEENTPSVF